MKRFIINAAFMVAVIVFSAVTVYGGGPMAPPKEGADPAAVKLVEQGIKFYEEKRWEAALDSFTLAIQIDSRVFVSYFNAGISLWEMGRMAEALSYLEEFAARNPGDPRGQRALLDLKKAYSSSPPDSGWGGFAEFGLASLAGFLFIFGIAALDIGAAPSTGSVKEKALKQKQGKEPRKPAVGELQTV
jgi:tetratricopeptide (TPR) repeat protein